MSRRRQSNRNETPKTSGFKPVVLKGRTPNQIEYIKAIYTSEVTICNGPAGTGKTFCSIGTAINALKNGHIDKIFLTRPAVGLGRDIGYLPGTQREKMNP